ncbi:Serine/threonine protein kinase [Tindallia magadiensis]|uniref:Serine/threonine protein kinase n=1 Tax=Tindallia magadiensis TaxID=69895 RepID=A0A1I3ERH5_9FIRM|nr:FHA domain-containing serine/threonine-protein kinase [Tindallia magadiensis]SFI01577.1 Serine/threonine protein kinase [Tindallia magadiensis]
MEANERCMGCMEKKTEESICENCGWEEGSGASSHMHLPPGTVLNRKYLLGRALGQGGFGITYLAHDMYLDRKLAIKEFFPRDLVRRDQDTYDILVHDREMQEQYDYGMEKFLEEGRTLAKFEEHPNIVSVQDFFKEKQSAYLVMNYIQGIALNDYLKEKGHPLAFREAQQIMMPVLDALKTVHEAGLLHRDISPDNIFLSLGARVMILDFGAARHAMTQQKRNYSIILKPGYAPPEQYRQSGNQGAWTDIYAAAATFYQTITGQMLPDALDRMDYEQVPWPDWIYQQTTPQQRQALEKALAVQVEERFQNIVDFQNALLSDAPRAVPETEADSASSAPLPSSPPPPPPPPPEFQQQTTVAQQSVNIPYQPVQTPVYQGIKNSNVINIGRSADNDIVIQEETISRHHARLTLENGQWYLQDLGSTHGTFMDGNPVKEATLLKESTYIKISHTTFYFNGKHLLSERGEVLHTLQKYEKALSSNPVGQQAAFLENTNTASKRLMIMGGVILLMVTLVILVYMVG